MASVTPTKFQPSLGWSIVGFVAGAVASVILGAILVEVVAVATSGRAQPSGAGWLMVPIGFGFAGAFASELIRKWNHERARAQRKKAREERTERAAATTTLRAASHDPQFAAALRQAIQVVEAGENEPKPEPVVWVQRIPVTLSGELMVKPSPPRVVGGAA
jgi:hypothetical protein